MTKLIKSCLLLLLQAVFIPPLSHAIPPPPAVQETTVGIYFGFIHVIDTDQKILMVVPIDSRLPRKTFYLDNQTLYQEDKKKIAKTKFHRGQKVAVRYFAEGMTAIADVVFLVSGEFEPRKYRISKRPVEKKQSH